MLSIVSILTYIYLFFGLIVAAFVLLASYNIYTKGYRANSAFFGILVVIVLFSVSFVSALSSIRSLGTELDKVKDTISNPNSKPITAPTNNTSKPAGKFY
jgi:hypothetical protein